jgi:hypothetical protein
MKQSVPALFSPRPDEWRLRGDAHLWDELAAHFADVAISLARMRRVCAR